MRLQAVSKFAKRAGKQDEFGKEREALEERVAFFDFSSLQGREPRETGDIISNILRSYRIRSIYVLSNLVLLISLYLDETIIDGIYIIGKSLIGFPLENPRMRRG